MLLKRSISCNRITERLNASIKVTKYTEERTQDLLCWTWTFLIGVKALWFCKRFIRHSNNNQTTIKFQATIVVLVTEF